MAYLRLVCFIWRDRFPHELNSQSPQKFSTMKMVLTSSSVDVLMSFSTYTKIYIYVFIGVC